MAFMLREEGVRSLQEQVLRMSHERTLVASEYFKFVIASRFYLKRSYAHPVYRLDLKDADSEGEDHVSVHLAQPYDYSSGHNSKSNFSSELSLAHLRSALKLLKPPIVGVHFGDEPSDVFFENQLELLSQMNAKLAVIFEYKINKYQLSFFFNRLRDRIKVIKSFGRLPIHEPLFEAMSLDFYQVRRIANLGELAQIMRHNVKKLKFEIDGDTFANNNGDEAMQFTSLSAIDLKFGGETFQLIPTIGRIKSFCPGLKSLRIKGHFCQHFDAFNFGSFMLVVNAVNGLIQQLGQPKPLGIEKLEFSAEALLIYERAIPYTTTLLNQLKNAVSPVLASIDTSHYSLRLKW